MRHSYVNIWGIYGKQRRGTRLCQPLHEAADYETRGSTWNHLQWILLCLCSTAQRRLGEDSWCLWLGEKLVRKCHLTESVKGQ